MAKKIMLVDDDTNLRKSTKLILEAEGYNVSEAINADDCWQKIQTSPPELILLDIRMPGTPAVELIRKIKENPKLRKIMIVYMTGVVGTGEVSKKLEGVVGAIEKPFQNAELIAVVKEAMGHTVI